MKSIFTSLDITIDSKLWNRNAFDFKKSILDAIIFTIKYIAPLRKVILGKRVEVAFTLSDDKTLQKLNNEYRNKNKPTNILSFQYHDWNNINNESFIMSCDSESEGDNFYHYDFKITDTGFSHSSAKKSKTLYLGDIAISYEKIKEEAKSQHRDIGEYLTFISVHGMLHLFGYDHITDEDADEMERCERDIMKMINKN